MSNGHEYDLYFENMFSIVDKNNNPVDDEINKIREFIRYPSQGKYSVSWRNDKQVLKELH